MSTANKRIAARLSRTELISKVSKNIEGGARAAFKMKTPELQKTWDSIQELSQLQIRPDVRTILNDATKNPEKFHALRALGLTTPQIMGLTGFSSTYVNAQLRGRDTKRSHRRAFKGEGIKVVITVHYQNATELKSYIDEVLESQWDVAPTKFWDGDLRQIQKDVASSFNYRVKRVSIERELKYATAK